MTAIPQGPENGSTPRSATSVNQYASSVKGVKGLANDPEHFDTLTLSQLTEIVKGQLHDLAKTVKTVRTGFRAVSDALGPFDEARYRGKNGEVLQLRPKWKGYEEEFNRILKCSQASATSASSMTKNYWAALTKVDPRNLDAFKKRIQKFIEKINTKIPEAEKMESDLRKLSDNVRLFGKSVLDSTYNQADGRLVSEIKRIESSLQGLKEQSATVSQRKRTNKIVAGVVGSCGILAFVGLCMAGAPGLIPIGIGAVVVAVCGGALYYHVGHLNPWESDIKSKMRKSDSEQRQATAKHDSLKGYQETLKGTKEQVAEVARKINAIGSIWKALKDDMLLLVEDLDNMDTDDPDLSLPREVYDRLADLLNVYARLDTSPNDN